MGRLDRDIQLPLNGTGRQAAAFNLQHQVEITLQALAVGQCSHIEPVYTYPATVARGMLDTVQTSCEPHLPGVGAQVRAEADIAERTLRIQVYVKFPP